MPWLLVDLLLALLALIVLGLVARHLYRAARRLSRSLSATATTVGELSAGLQVTPRP